jgi:hypothetical protein
MNSPIAHEATRARHDERLARSLEASARRPQSAEPVRRVPNGGRR